MQKIGILIGRLNPPHIGHVKILKTSLKNNNKTILFFGSTNIVDEKNPFTFEERKYFIEKIFKKYITSNKLIIDYLEDMPSDETWTRNVGEKIKKYIDSDNDKITIFGGDFQNDSAIIVIKEYINFLKVKNIDFFEVYRKSILLSNNEEISSTKVREAFNNKNPKKAITYLPYGLKSIVYKAWKKKFK